MPLIANYVFSNIKDSLNSNLGNLNRKDILYYLGKI